MGNFAEVLTNNKAKDINKINNEIGKKSETFNDSLIAHKAKSSTGVATISINPNKTKAMGRLQLALTIKAPLGPIPVLRIMVAVVAITVRRKPLTRERVKGSV